MKNLDNIATLMEKFEGVLNEILDELEKSYEDDVCNDEKLAKAKDDYDDALMELDDLYREKEYELDEYIPNIFKKLKLKKNQLDKFNFLIELDAKITSKVFFIYHADWFPHCSFSSLWDQPIQAQIPSVLKIQKSVEETIFHEWVYCSFYKKSFIFKNEDLIEIWQNLHLY
jgi:hypothetical protein